MTGSHGQAFATCGKHALHLQRVLPGVGRWTSEVGGQGVKHSWPLGQSPDLQHLLAAVG